MTLKASPVWLGRWYHHEYRKEDGTIMNTGKTESFGWPGLIVAIVSASRKEISSDPAWYCAS